MTLSNNRWLRLFTLCALYLAQGIPWGFVTITLAAFLADKGLGVEAIGDLLALSMLPWAFKWAWGPIIDRFGLPAMGRRRPWILLAQAMMALTIGAMLAIGDLADNLELLGALVFVHNVFNALQDVAVDALAVDLLSEQERGTANGLMYGSKYLGGAVGGALLSLVLAEAGLEAALLVEVLLLGAIFLLPLFLLERPGDRFWPWSRRAPASAAAPPEAAVPSVLELFRDLYKAFALRSTLLGVALALAIELAAGVLGAVTPVLMVKSLGWTQTEYAALAGGWGLAIGLAGAALGGLLADRVGHRRLAALASVLLGATWLVWAATESAWGSEALLTALILAGRLFTSVMAVSLFALFMDVSWPRVAATQFTAYMALLNLGTTLGSDLAGGLQGALGDAGLFAAAGLFQIVVVALLRFIDPHQTRRVLGER